MHAFEVLSWFSPGEEEAEFDGRNLDASNLLQMSASFLSGFGRKLVQVCLQAASNDVSFKNGSAECLGVSDAVKIILL